MIVCKWVDGGKPSDLSGHELFEVGSALVAGRSHEDALGCAVEEICLVGTDPGLVLGRTE